MTSTIKRAGTTAARRLIASALLMLACASLAACTSTRSGQTITAPQTIDASKAMLLPAPGGPEVVEVIEERFANAVQQKVILGTTASTQGQNFMTIQLFGPMERETQGTKTLGYRQVNPASVSREYVREIPGVAMKISGVFLRNSYGPIGYAFGQSNSGDSCIYGWQQLRTAEEQRSNYRNVGAIQIRLRLCEAGASEKDLLSVMYGYTINGTFSSDQWNPYGRAQPADIETGAGQTPIYPNDGDLADAPAVKVSTGPVRKRVIVRQPVTEDEEQTTGDDESTVRPVVEVPGPLGASDDAAPDQSDVNSITNTGNQVVVPPPGCDSADATCN